MINKQKMWFITLFSLILILSVYYITMPSELLTTMKTTEKTSTTKAKSEVSVTESDFIAALQVEKDEERSALVAKYNEILTNKESSFEEKNNAYNGIKEIDNIKAIEEKIKNKINEELKLNSFIKIDGNNVNITIKKENHDYSLANSIMKLAQKEFEQKMYISVKFQK